MLNKDWKHVGLFSHNSKYIPAVSGIYLIIDLKKRVLKIPIGVDVVYAGKGNLRRRFLAHSSVLSEHNKQLASLVQSKSLEFWFIEVNDNELDYYETIMIQEMDKYNPNLTNEIKMKTKQNNGGLNAKR